MNNFDNFDDLVKKKMDGLEYPFNEENWQKASQMIDASRKAANKNILKTLAISIVIITVSGFAGYFMFTQFRSDNIADVKIKNTSGTLITEKLTTQKVEKPETLIGTSNSDIITNTNEKHTLSLNDERTQFNTEVSKNQRPTKHSGSSNKSENITATSNNKSNNQLNTGGTELRYNNSGNDKTSYSAIGEIENAKQKTLSQTTNDTESSEAIFEKPLSNENIVVTDSSNSENGNVNISSKTSTILTGNGLQPDTANTIHVKTDYVRVKHHELIVEAGALNSFGWKVGEKRNGNSLTPLAGINYVYHFNQHSALLTGIQYNAISNLTESNVSFSVTSYNFGSKSDVTTFKLTELQQLILPFKYIHTFDNKHTLGLGLNFSYLMNIKNRIETFKVVDGGAGTVNSRNDSGYGFELCRTFNGQIALSYGYKITEKLSVQAELNKTMFNLFNNYSVFNNIETNNKPSALKLSLTYSLFRK